MTLGVELELQLLDWRTFDLCPAAPRVLEKLGGESARIKPEIFQSMIEINTGICRNVAEVRGDLSSSLAKLRVACDALGVELAAGGSHPFADYAKRLLYPSQRYRHLIERNQWLARRLLIFGLHVHVGMRDGDHAIAMMNGIGPYLGHLLALSASSPFWFGEETGLASTRVTIFESVPTAGTPPVLANWAAFEAFHDKMIASRSIESMKDLWWDVRPNPNFGTLEVRICDGLQTLDEIIALVAFLQVLLEHLDERYRAGESFPPPPSWLLRENKWRAARHGVDANLLVDVGATDRPLRSEVERLLADLQPTAARCSCSEELRTIKLMLEKGCGYHRQRAVYAESRSLAAVASLLVDELRRGLE
jgi:glutamate---cysteine ligase / carboxylate-amine ligase